MSDYTQVTKAMNAGTPPELICATCPWDRLCVTPPTMTTADVDRAIKNAEEMDRKKDPSGQKMPAATLMVAMTMAGRDTMGSLCPVFALRLRSPEGRGIADAIRIAMRGAEQ